LNRNIIIIKIIALIIIIAVAYFLLINDDDTRDDDQNGTTSNLYDNCTILSARSLHEKMFFNISEENVEEDQGGTTPSNVSINKTVLTITYDGLTDGECIVIRDNASIVNYSEEEGKTTITFSWYEDQYTKTHVYYYFLGNITSEFNEGDEVAIKLTLKHVETETNSTIYILDVFEEQWESEQYFIENVQSILISEGLKNMDPALITKI
jgi:hypothetical protein